MTTIEEERRKLMSGGVSSILIVEKPRGESGRSERNAEDEIRAQQRSSAYPVRSECVLQVTESSLY